MRRVSSLRAAEAARELTIAGPSFLNNLFVPRIAESLPGHRVRSLELAPALVRLNATENIFDLALTLGQENFPDTWSSSKIGAISKGLFAPPALAKRFGRRPISSDRLAGIAFVVPIYLHGGRFVVADEGCPIGTQREVGHEVQTIALALELAARTGQLVFSPRIVARPYVERGELIEIVVDGWHVSETLFVSCNNERVTARARDSIVSGVRAELARLDVAPARREIARS
jgi:hypothetical protein